MSGLRALRIKTLSAPVATPMPTRVDDPDCSRIGRARSSPATNSRSSGSVVNHGSPPAYQDLNRLRIFGFLRLVASSTTTAKAVRPTESSVAAAVPALDSRAITNTAGYAD